MADRDYPLEISVHVAQSLLNAKPPMARVIDVREPPEFEICAIADSELIPMATVPEKMADLAREEHLLILCHHGHRSRRVTHFLRAHGFDRVSNITGGIDAWASEVEPGMPRY